MKSITAVTRQLKSSFEMHEPLDFQTPTPKDIMRALSPYAIQILFQAAAKKLLVDRDTWQVVQGITLELAKDD